MNIILDCETTDFRPGQISQLSYIIMNDNKIKKAKNYFFKVETVNKGVVDITGKNTATLDYLSDGMTFAEQAEEVFADLNGNLLIGHNISFDYNFLVTEFARLGIDFIVDTYCTMKQPREDLKRDFIWNKANFSQEDLKDIFKISDLFTKTLVHSLFGNVTVGRHDSRWDVCELYLIYDKLVKGGYVK